MACAHVLLKTMDMMDEEGSIHLSLGSLQQYVRLDSSAAEAINLFPPERGERPWMENGSLYQILNKCKTKMGERLLQRWLRQPLVDPAKINARLDIVQQLTEDVHLRCSLQDDALRGTPDLETLALKLQRKKADLYIRPAPAPLCRRARRSESGRDRRSSP
ncbi:dna mismatch repair protein msh2 [Nannochloropsis oceanica]